MNFLGGRKFIINTSFTVRGGLSLREGIHLMELIHKTGRLGAVDLVEVNPEIGTNVDVSKTVEAAIHILQAACGNHRKGIRPQNDDKLVARPPTGKTT